MKTATRVLFSAAFVSMCALTSSAQKTEMTKAFTYEGRLSKQYDKFEDKTTYTLTSVPVYEVGDLRLTVGASFTAKGQEKSPELLVGFIVAATTKTRVQAKDSRLFAIVDGQRKEYGELSLLGDSKVAP